MTELHKLIESIFLKLGAVRAEVNSRGVATHWNTRIEAERALEKIVEIVATNYLKLPPRSEVFQNKNGTWAMFAEWPVT